MNLEIKKIKLGNNIFDVTDIDTYVDNKNLYDENYTAVTIPNSDYVYPIVTRNELKSKPGVTMGEISFFNDPSGIDKENYSKDNIIDFKNATNMKEIIEKSNTVRNLENEILVNSDNVTSIRIDSNDSIEMVALKDAINSKKCDLNLYAQRFNGNFANDRRILTDSNITLGKLKKFCVALDISLSLSLKDKDSNVANPMNRVIEVDLLDGGEDSYE